MNPLFNNKYGCWVCTDKIPFNSKLEALKYATQTNQQVGFYYHNHIWEKFNRDLLGKLSLPEIYKERAQQLRDSYDHLVLHYSGGSDSHNILHTFLVNNIKLDEISVRWIKPLRDGKLYTPNTKDTSARNAASEWDFAIKPTLDWLALHHPEIKITVADYGSNLDSKTISVANAEKRLIDMNINRGGLGTFSMWVDPTLESRITSKTSRKTGHLYGIEKPILFMKDNSIYVQFMDAVFENAILPRGRTEGTVEMFYWSPEYPLLPMEQAYQTALYFKHHIQSREFLWTDQLPSQAKILKQYEEQGNIHKRILYRDSWNVNKFQVEKPNLLRSDWYFWLYENKELEQIKQNWEIAMTNLTSGIDSQFLLQTEDPVSLLRPMRTRPFHILNLD